MKTGFAVIGFVVVALVVGTCVACNEDEGENGWSPRVEQLANHGYDDGGDECWDYGSCGGGYDERNGGSGDGRGGDGRFGGGRSGDYDGGPGDDCRNACGNTIIVPTPGDRGGEQR